MGACRAPRQSKRRLETYLYLRGPQWPLQRPRIWGGAAQCAIRCGAPTHAARTTPAAHRRCPAAAPKTRAAAAAAAATSAPPAGLWLAANPSKRWTEVFYLAYSPFWILWALCVLVPFQLYEVRTASYISLRRAGPASRARYS
jgi:hypothetical protein